MIRGPSDFRVAPESAMLRGPSDFRASGHPCQVAWRLLTLSALSRRPIGRTAVPHDDQILYLSLQFHVPVQFDDDSLTLILVLLRLGVPNDARCLRNSTIGNLQFNIHWSYADGAPETVALPPN